MNILVNGIITQGFIYGIMAMGVILTYLVLDFPDLTVDGSFPLGGAVAASLIVSGVNPWIGCIAAFFAGVLAGMLTGFLHVKLHIKNLLSSIITMTALYSINLHIVGKANLFIEANTTIFYFENSVFSSLPRETAALLVAFFIALVIKLALDWFMKTKKGFLVRTVGDNPQLVTSLGQDIGTVKIIGLAIANGCAALAGAVICQYQQFYDISIGTGTIVMGLAAVILGKTIFGRLRFLQLTTIAILGTIVYRATIAIALNIGFESMDLKLITAVVFVAALIISSTELKENITRVFKGKSNAGTEGYKEDIQ